jgi:hypothetical protein
MFWAKIPGEDALFDSIAANLISTALIGFGVPLAVALISILTGAALPAIIGSYAMALGTWAYEGVQFPKIMFASTIFWWVVTFFLTVYVEKQVLLRRWKKREYICVKSARQLSWVSNIITYLGLLAVLYSFLKDIKFIG